MISRKILRRVIFSNFRTGSFAANSQRSQTLDRVYTNQRNERRPTTIDSSATNPPIRTMADAMDWHPTTPPPTHNPYSDPRYMPGGWPESPPPFQHTAGVFAKKREAGVTESAAKRVCTGIKTFGTYAALPVKPLYIIIRRWRRQEHQSPRRSTRRSAAQSRRVTPGMRARIAAAERNSVTQETQPTPQQTATPPATPPLSEQQKTIQSSVADGSIGTTNIETPVSAKGVTTPAYKTTGASGVKRSKTDTDAEEDSPNICLQHSTLSSYLAAQSSGQPPIPTPARHMPVKKMKKVNHFDADYKRSPTTYAARGLTPMLSLKPIGATLESDGKIDSVWGSWVHEKPIRFGNYPHDLGTKTSTDEQLRSELDFHVSGVDEAAGELKIDQSESIPNHATNDPDSVVPVAPIPLHDERWSCSRLLEQFFPDEFCESKEATTEQALPDIASSALTVRDDPSSTGVERLFHENKPKHIPPPIRRRPLRSTARLQPPKSQGSEANSIVEQDITDDKVPEEGNTPIDTQANTEVQSSNGEVSGVLHPADRNASDISPGAKATVDSSTAPVPVTPMKVVAEKPAQEISETPVFATENIFETPAEKLSKLNIKDTGDNDTPKATPHSGTKTTRVTRYREALEKAQRAKLQQYELVPITDEWDQKVRDAIHKGIPDYLGSRDLARVVPQYAHRGQDNWLNDETINKYLDIVAAHGRKNDRPDQVKSHHAFNNFFYNNLNQKGARSVLSWSKRAKIGGKNLAYVEKVFIPINSGAHWTLAVVEPTKKRITHYNSMRGSATGVRACENLKEWVALEIGRDFREEEWTLTAVGESPQQTNSDDCGVFTITSARQIMLGYTPMSYRSAQIPIQRIRIVAELINRALLKSTGEE